MVFKENRTLHGAPDNFSGITCVTVLGALWCSSLTLQIQGSEPDFFFFDQGGHCLSSCPALTYCLGLAEKHLFTAFQENGGENELEVLKPGQCELKRTGLIFNWQNVDYD